MFDWTDRIECPLMFHYGDRDPYLPASQVAAVEAAFASRPNTVMHRYDAGHAFSDWDAPSMFNQPVADLAWRRTLDFLDECLR